LGAGQPYGLMFDRQRLIYLPTVEMRQNQTMSLTEKEMGIANEYLFQAPYENAFKV
jgi:hypothetical protein